MAITYVAYGSGSTTATSPATPAYPAGLASGDLLVLHTVVRESAASTTVATPSGWDARGVVFGGAGAEGADTGNARVAVFTKEATGSESGTLSVTASGGTLSVLAARMSAFRKGSGSWDIAHATATDNAGGAASLSFTYGSDPGLTAGDVAVVCVGVNTDLYTYSGHALTASGITEGTVTVHYANSTSTGNDLAYSIISHAIASGTSSGVPSVAITASGSAASSPAGASVLLRLREVASGGSSIAVISSHLGLHSITR